MKKAAFTLAELIVVIVILVILGTIAFINFKGATLSARDSVRISDVTNITNGLFLYNTKTGIFPAPENAISVTYSGNEISKVGNLSTTSLASLGLSGGLVDPQTKDPYPYTLTSDNKVMILSKLEGDSSLLTNTVNAVDDEVFVKGNAKSIYLTSDFKVPISTVELTNTSDSKDYVVINKDSKITKGQLSSIKGGAFTSCNDVNNLLPGNSKGQFDVTINGKIKSVYCDSGWMRSHLLRSSALTHGLTTTESKVLAYDNLFKLDKTFPPESYTMNILDIPFTKYRYTTGNNLTDIDEYSDPIVMYGNYNDGINDWIESYDKNYNTKPSTKPRPTYVFYTENGSRIETLLNGGVNGRRNMYTERLLNAKTGIFPAEWQSTSMPFGKRGLESFWCVGGNNPCTPNTAYNSADPLSGMKAYASLWIK